MKSMTYFARMALSFSLLAVNAQCQNTVELIPFSDGFVKPVAITHASDSRLFVVEQKGTIRIVDAGGNLFPQPFLDLSSTVNVGGNEQGLLGLAFHPDYGTNGFFYVNYTDAGNDTHIARFSVSSANPDLADPLSEKTLLLVEQPFTNHNGGDLAFGPDGYLYIGLGDGGSGGDPGNRAQSLDTFLGKMLRIDVDNGDPYAIPPDNPFINNPEALPEIWAYGLRNPWRFSFDRLTGDLWIGDVGQNAYEEIDFQPASSPGGENYGWRCYEGNHPYNTNGCGTSENYEYPVHEYSHSFGCSITGGYVYRGGITSMTGRYFFADYCTDYIWSLYLENNEWVPELLGQFSGNNFSAFGENAGGELFVAGHSSGTIYKFSSTSSGFNPGNRSDRVNIFPNPFRDHIQLDITDRVESVSLVIRNLQGVKLFEAELHSVPGVVNLEFLPAGTFLLSLTGSGMQKHQLVTKLL